MSKRINWKNLYSKIPDKFRAGDDIIKVQWIDEFPKDKRQVGESNFNNNTITLKKNEKIKDTVHTYFHECLHIFSDQFDINLTENQVRKLEKTLKYWIKTDNIFKED